MKLILAILDSDDFPDVLESLREMSVSHTHLASTGGFLSGSRDTLLAAVPDDDVPEVISAITRRCFRPPERTPEEDFPGGISYETLGRGLLDGGGGGAVIFVLRLMRFIKM